MLDLLFLIGQALSALFVLYGGYVAIHWCMFNGGISHDSKRTDPQTVSLHRYPL
jgi:hypothetical protein